MRVFNGRSSKAANGFTLIELLAVMVVIGILGAILMAMAGRVREGARSAQCVSNLRQMHVGVILFAEDNLGKLPTGAPAPVHFIDGARKADWRQQIVPYIYDVASVRQADDWKWSDFQVPALFRCPSARELAHARHYGANVRVMPIDLSDQRLLSQFSSTVVLIADANAEYPAIIRPDTEASLFGDGRMAGAGPGVTGRHHGRANVLFLGGEVESLRIDQLPSVGRAPDREEGLWGEDPRRFEFDKPL